MNLLKDVLKYKALRPPRLLHSPQNPGSATMDKFASASSGSSTPGLLAFLNFLNALGYKVHGQQCFPYLRIAPQRRPRRGTHRVHHEETRGQPAPLALHDQDLVLPPPTPTTSTCASQTRSTRSQVS